VTPRRAHVPPRVRTGLGGSAWAAPSFAAISGTSSCSSAGAYDGASVWRPTPRYTNPARRAASRIQEVAPVEQDRRSHRTGVEVEPRELRPLRDVHERVRVPCELDGIRRELDVLSVLGRKASNRRIVGPDTGSQPRQFGGDLQGGRVPQVVGLGLPSSTCGGRTFATPDAAPPGAADRVLRTRGPPGRTEDTHWDRALRRPWDDVGSRGLEGRQQRRAEGRLTTTPIVVTMATASYAGGDRYAIRAARRCYSSTPRRRQEITRRQRATSDNQTRRTDPASRVSIR
jgi:hypothetical protein